jgi:hypothetical protein
MSALNDWQQAEKIVDLEMPKAIGHKRIYEPMIAMVLTAIRSERVRAANVAKNFGQVIANRQDQREFSFDQIRDAIMEEPGREEPRPSARRTRHS